MIAAAFPQYYVDVRVKGKWSLDKSKSFVECVATKAKKVEWNTENEGEENSVKLGEWKRTFTVSVLLDPSKFAFEPNTRKPEEDDDDDEEVAKTPRLNIDTSKAPQFSSSAPSPVVKPSPRTIIRDSDIQQCITTYMYFLIVANKFILIIF